MFKKFLAAGFVAALLSGTAIAGDAKVTDPQIAHIAYTAGQIDIAAAQQALKKSKNPDILEFARTMERDHKAVNDQALALVKKLKVTPEDNDISKSLAADAQKKLDAFAKLEGEDFDKAYAENEAKYHKAVDDALASTLIPSAKNAELKSLLETGLTLFQQHQAHAEHLAGMMK